MSEEKVLSFEEAFSRLEQIVRRLESGEANLDESLRLFEEGVKLARVCSSRLDAAEGKIQQLLEKPDGTVEEVPFELPGTESS
ncbi:MAG: exodeoxyribonuclease VII small subunit [Clostridia bacterium]|nr:exodeoxyribonuclease VII small subunit [Bacillota bacterium]